ncbi:type IV fimbrial biogenesis protein FimT [Chromobacterium alkanivorans]|uniref:GspH/FimT family pseudopilin n=1 Tax=Chromobacterium alkanivorans TaxID=1071719 RepID=UPI002169AF7C|nr:GspH/FimT family pseudopilin [Chromobacterium alkanivorans]MCS3802903.1 type IV fimbrial biogenesis protein FimT [Chromobacterium alkanivorans]MCS3817229.1 type IV fimbrial biogenesis protein FimT [Chromobacterium alkanivorans]MCS3872269.1 type IV fimbrial biogenesis protein FimT [Chromobacterium alkanivorans]
MRAQIGFTLIEAMTVLAILLLCLAIAAPGLGRLVSTQQLRSHAQAMANLLHFARSEALRSNRPVFVCAANLKRNLQLQGCARQRQVWDRGALVYADRDGGGQAGYDSQERLHLLVFAAGRVRVRVGRDQLSFLPNGRLERGQGVSLWLESPLSGQCLLLQVSGHGRADIGKADRGCPS